MKKNDTIDVYLVRTEKNCVTAYTTEQDARSDDHPYDIYDQELKRLKLKSKVPVGNGIYKTKIKVIDDVVKVGKLVSGDPAYGA